MKPVESAGDVSGSSSVDDAPRVSGAPEKEPSTARGCLTVIVVATVLGVIVTIAAGAGQGQPPADPAASYVRSVGGDATRVKVAATNVQTAIARAVRSPSRRDLAGLSRIGSAAADSLGDVRQEFATRAVTGTVGDAEVEVFTAANGLEAAIGVIVSRAGVRDPVESALAGPAGQLENAVGEWNDAVRVIWRAAGDSGRQPTIS
jgi:hypothetical protein